MRTKSEAKSERRRTRERETLLAVSATLAKEAPWNQRPENSIAANEFQTGSVLTA